MPTTVACVQMDIEIGNVRMNRDRIARWLNASVEAGADLAIFPECAVTGYCFESLDEAAEFAEPLSGPTAEMIERVCAEMKVHAIVGFIEREGDHFYNAAMLVGPEGIEGSYRKVHLPFLGVDRFVTPGDRPFVPFDTGLGRIGINICYDAGFPEAARVLKLLGSDLIALPTNWPEGAWRTPEFMINSRAHENHINYAAAARVGVERGWRFIGRSKIVDYNGDTLAEARDDSEQVITASLDLTGASRNRIVNVAGEYELDRIGHRRPEFYGQLVEHVRVERPRPESPVEEREVSSDHVS